MTSYILAAAITLQTGMTGQAQTNAASSFSDMVGNQRGEPLSIRTESDFALLGSMQPMLTQ